MSCAHVGFNLECHFRTTLVVAILLQLSDENVCFENELLGVLEYPILSLAILGQDYDSLDVRWIQSNQFLDEFLNGQWTCLLGILLQIPFDETMTRDQLLWFRFDYDEVVSLEWFMS